MGFGGYPDVSLADAREARHSARQALRAGNNPIELRAKNAKKHGETYFGEFATALIDDLAPGFKNAKHLSQWRNTIKTYCVAIENKSVGSISTEDVLKVLKPIWNSKPETASRLRGRIERILDAARAKGYTDSQNPARWKGHLEALLPKRDKLSRGHFAAMPFMDLPEFFEKLKDRRSTAALALEFLILTAARTSEVLEAQWSEIDFEQRIWTIPALRMKASKEHRVPLSQSAVELLNVLKRDGQSNYVFPGQKPNKPLSGMSMTMLLRRMGAIDVTVHGFRSSFRDWVGEKTAFPREVAEAALAHEIGSKTERAYRRGDAIEKRRTMMQDWADFLYLRKATASTHQAEAIG